MNEERPWTTYRTRFLVRARQLTEPLCFKDALGREHRGEPGDYLVESDEGFRRIAPRRIFEDIYVPLERSYITRSSRAPVGRTSGIPPRQVSAQRMPAWSG